MLRRPVKYLEGAGRAFNILACIAVIAMMLLSTADVVMRLFGKPIPGTYELVGFLGAIVVSFALVFTSMEKGHIAVEILVEKLPQRAQLSIEAVCNLIGALLFGVIAYQAVLYALDMKQSGEVSLTLQMPPYPFIFGIAAGCALLCLLLVADFIKSVQRTIDA
ncbi:MAG TPA: TRAP transporter small permease [Smithellaceae bacterium]|nr:MAG: Tripartite ATP-independent periplasmic transporter [Deltaproteobacteria bacterium ADurb.Bin002]HOE22691.1 TRAP transporter small permease [Smithellaceae bacterium]HOU56873.1 TRAP transporter small permease [Smithellaceae bacterium]HQH00564.1 TRAP transporter small permease [Smithellaceae bacterium]HQH05490.1 TRAP transporter small permease [Smithellaceae bacterium]